jgi:hypothetical protein
VRKKPKAAVKWFAPNESKDHTHGKGEPSPSRGVHTSRRRKLIPQRESQWSHLPADMTLLLDTSIRITDSFLISKTRLGSANRQWCQPGFCECESCAKGTTCTVWLGRGYFSVSESQHFFFFLQPVIQRFSILVHLQCLKVKELYFLPQRRPWPT